MKKLWSIFTDDMDHCMFTGSAPVERHHCFYLAGGGMKEKCEKYGFIAPLKPELHPNGVFAGQSAKAVDTVLKQRCQQYYEENYGTREQFMSEFGRNYL
ncbi:MAG: phosphoenolpyruvate carboxykinase [Lachnospiraceae bacterium]|nr:phosphoenolpyruvate carboxykinase [Lachnospiraceae bacterium]